jgi:hypothetical protein
MTKQISSPEDTVNALHKKQMLRKISEIKVFAEVNNTGNIDIMSATLSHIQEKAEAIIVDYTEKDS